MAHDVLNYATPAPKQPGRSLATISLAWSLISALAIGLSYFKLRELTNSHVAANLLVVILFGLPLLSLILATHAPRDAIGKRKWTARAAIPISIIQLLGVVVLAAQ